MATAVPSETVAGFPPAAATGWRLHQRVPAETGRINSRPIDPTEYRSPLEAQASADRAPAFPQAYPACTYSSCVLRCWFRFLREFWRLSDLKRISRRSYVQLLLPYTMVKTRAVVEEFEASRL